MSSNILVCYYYLVRHLEGLNPKQKEAVLYTTGPLLIVAGAGAGKTKTITHRIINLIKEGISPDKILAVTFTNKAAKEMRERVLSQMERDTQGQDSIPFISTFHSLGVFIIKENAQLLGLNKHFSILDESDANKIIKDALKELSIDPKQHDPKKIKSIISKEKGKFREAESYMQSANSYLGDIVGRVWSLYERKKQAEGALDFDDLLLKAVKILKENEGVRRVYQERWEYVHIDEYQDTNESQYLMAKLLSENHKNICVVGDYDQCLKKGTKISMSDGTKKPIEKIKAGDMVLSNFGSGKISESKVIKTKTLDIVDDYLIKITTKNKKEIISTKDHIHFAGYKANTTPQMYLNYLMYKKDFGWRIGTTSVYTKGVKKSSFGFAQRSNQEHADALWIISTHKTGQEARIEEYILSLKYQIPTIPFTQRKGLSINGYVHDKKALRKIFASFETNQSARRLLRDIGLPEDHPHYIPQSSNSNRKNINVTLCADKRGQNPMHLISIFGNDQKDKIILQKLGFSVRSAKKKSVKNWRFETIRSNFGEACLLATKIASSLENARIVFKARLGNKKESNKEHNSLPFTPASSVMPGMVLFSGAGYDLVEKVNKIKTKDKKVYDIDIEKSHNFIANDIITHNCIYSWRGANLKNILNFEKDYKDAKVVMLEENYRSTQNILEAANEVIKKNKWRPDKNLYTKNKTGEKISLYEALDEGDEAEFVATKILEIVDHVSTEGVLAEDLGSRDDDGQRNFSTGKFRVFSENTFAQIAILYRANFQSRILEEAMLRHNIPYQVLGVKFFERKEIKDTLAYIRAALNPNSLSDIKRIINFPARGIGKTTLAKLFGGERESLPAKMQIKINNFYSLLEDIKEKTEELTPSEVIKFVVKKSGIEEELLNGGEEDKERLENIKELATLALKYEELKGTTGIEKLLEDAALASDQDSLIDKGIKKEEINAVKLMTVHASKGLEFKNVFIVGLEDGLFPHQRDGSKGEEDAEEERRLFYVALTRAKEKLFLSFANFRTIFGSRQINTLSEFVLDIPPDLLEKADEAGNIKTIYI